MTRHPALDLADEVQAQFERSRKLGLSSHKLLQHVEENLGHDSKDLAVSIREVRTQETARNMIDADLLPRVIDELQAVVERLEEVETEVDHELAWAYGKLRNANWSKWEYMIVGFVIGISIGAGFVHFAL